MATGCGRTLLHVFIHWLHLHHGLWVWTGMSAKSMSLVDVLRIGSVLYSGCGAAKQSQKRFQHVSLPRASIGQPLRCTKTHGGSGGMSAVTPHTFLITFVRAGQTLAHTTRRGLAWGYCSCRSFVLIQAEQPLAHATRCDLVVL